MALQKCSGCGKRDPTNFYRSKPMYTKDRFWIFFMVSFVIVAVAISL